MINHKHQNMQTETQRTPMTIREVIASEHYGLLEEIEHGSSDQELINYLIKELKDKTGYEYIID